MRPSRIEKRSVVVGGHKTSVSLEEEFWQGLKAMAQTRQTTLSKLLETIDLDRTPNFSSSLRLYVLQHYRAKAAE